MAQTGYVHGSTDPREVARLEKQADFTAAFTFPTLKLSPGLRVLDLATGVGAMGARLQRLGVTVVGVDLSKSQLAASQKNHPDLPVLRGDATRLPFPDATFDRVHCSWLLEHVPHPLSVLKEVRRVLKPQGFCQFVEVDNATLKISPPSIAVDELMTLLNAAQRAAGGDPFVGRRLETLFHDAGFDQVDVVRSPLLGHHAEARFFQSFVDEFAEIYEGLDESLGAAHAALITQAVTDLRTLLRTPDASMTYTPVIARGWRLG